MSAVGNDTVGASDTGPASGYNLKLSHLFIIFVPLLYRLSVNTTNLYTVIILLIINNSMIFLLDFKIKIYHKMAKHLTIYFPAHPRSSSWTFLEVASFRDCHGLVWNCRLPSAIFPQKPVSLSSLRERPVLNVRRGLQFSEMALCELTTLNRDSVIDVT
jgi:hypothetical protein